MLGTGSEEWDHRGFWRLQWSWDIVVESPWNARMNAGVWFKRDGTNHSKNLRWDQKGKYQWNNNIYTPRTSIARSQRLRSSQHPCILRISSEITLGGRMIKQEWKGRFNDLLIIRITITEPQINGENASCMHVHVASSCRRVSNQENVSLCKTTQTNKPLFDGGVAKQRDLNTTVTAASKQRWRSIYLNDTGCTPYNGKSSCPLWLDYMLA